MDRPVLVLQHLQEGKKLLDIEYPPGVRPKPVVLCEAASLMLQKELLYDVGLGGVVRIPVEYPGCDAIIPATEPFEKCSACGTFYKEVRRKLCPLCRRAEQV